MIITVFALLFMVISFSFFFASTAVNSVNRSLLYLPVELLQSHVNIISVDDEEDLYFSRGSLTNALDNYFDSTVSGHVLSYESSYIFTDKDNTMVCIGTSAKCQGIKINIDAEIYFGVHYEKTMFYSIGER